MATAEQIKSLIRSHLNDQPEQFFTTDFITVFRVNMTNVNVFTFTCEKL